MVRQAGSEQGRIRDARGIAPAARNAPRRDAGENGRTLQGGGCQQRRQPLARRSAGEDAETGRAFRQARQGQERPVEQGRVAASRRWSSPPFRTGFLIWT